MESFVPFESLLVFCKASDALFLALVLAALERTASF
jgi:hypothetical protein